MTVPTLRTTELADLERIVAWEQAADNARFILPWTLDRHAEALGDHDIRHLVAEVAGSPVGFVILAGLGGGHDSIEFRRIVIDRKGLGLGRATVEAVKRLCFDDLGAHRLWLDVKEHNLRARRLYDSCGFRAEGVLRDSLKTVEGYESLVVMSLLSHEYRVGASEDHHGCGPRSDEPEDIVQGLRPAHPYRYELPTRADVAARLRRLISGHESRQDAAAWAAEFIKYDDPQLYPEVTDAKVWDALMQIEGVDLPSTDREYLHGVEDIREWLADLLA